MHPSPYSSPCTLHPVELATLSAAADREVGHCKEEEEDPPEQVATSCCSWWDGPGTALLLLQLEVEVEVEVVEEVGSLLFFFWRSLLGEERELKRENS